MTGPTSAPSFDLDDSASNLADWLKAHGRQVGFGALGVAAVAGVLWVVRAQNERNEMTASQQLATAQRSVGSGNLTVAAEELKKLGERYGSTRAGSDANVLLAQVHLQQGKADEALKVLGALSTSGPNASSVFALRGAAQEQLGKFEDAAAAYLRASESTVLEAEAESFKSDAARAWLAAGKREEALKIWQAISTNPASVLYSESLLRVGELTAK